jgi:hypothetical protein
LNSGVNRRRHAAEECEEHVQGGGIGGVRQDEEHTAERGQRPGDDVVAVQALEGSRTRHGP